MKRFLVSVMTLLGFMSTGFAQNQLSKEEIANIVNSIETDWRFGVSHVKWMENANTFSYYMSTIYDRCPEELEDVLNWSEKSYKENQQILQLEKQIYSKPGSKKAESNLSSYFKDTEKAKKKFASAKEAQQMYDQMMKVLPPLIELKNKQEYKVPQGELTYFEYHSGGGMVRRPASHAELMRQKDGSYIATLDTYYFNKLDTIAVTQAQVDTIRQMLIDGEVYKMPKLYDEVILVLDAPHSSASVRFTDASFSCNSYPPSKWGGKNLYAVYKYLKALQPKREMTEEERKMFY